jgi:hypothetical protein
MLELQTQNRAGIYMVGLLLENSEIPSSTESWVRDIDSQTTKGPKEISDIAIRSLAQLTLININAPVRILLFIGRK